MLGRRGKRYLVVLVVALFAGADGAGAQTQRDPAAGEKERSEAEAPADEVVLDPPQEQQVDPLAEPWWVEAGRACDGCPWRRPGHAILQTTFVNVLYGLGNLARGQVTARVTPKTWWANMQHGWVWDLDDFAVNQIGHPYQGNNYFTSGRGNGLNYWESGAVTAFGSATWEFFGETNKASLNDFINTTMGGMALGEVLHRMSWLVRDTQATGTGRRWREIAATAIDPLTGLNRFVSGDANRQTGTPPELVPSGLTGFVGAGVLWQGEDGQAIESTGKPFLDFDFFYGDMTTGRSRVPYDAFFFTARLGGGSGIGRALIRGRLVGRPLGRTQMTLAQRYDFEQNPVYEFGAQSFDLSMGFEPHLTSRLSVRLTGGAGLTFLGAVDSQPIIEVDIPLPPEEEQGQGISEGPRTFDYGPGTNFGGSAAFRYDGRAFALLYYQANHLYVVDGVRANHFLQRMGVDLRVPIRGSVGLGVAGEFFHKKTFFQIPEGETRSKSAPQLRGFLTWRF